MPNGERFFRWARQKFAGTPADIRIFRKRNFEELVPPVNGTLVRMYIFMTVERNG